MTDEEFYKNLLIEIFNEHFGKQFFDNKDLFMPTHWANKLEYLWEEPELINIKRKLIIKEKTWYKLRNGQIRYVFAVVPLDFYFPCEMRQRVLCFDENGRSYRHLDGTMTGKGISDDYDLIRECTPEEVKEIEAKLTEKKNDNE